MSNKATDRGRLDEIGDTSNSKHVKEELACKRDGFQRSRDSVKNAMTLTRRALEGFEANSGKGSESGRFLDEALAADKQAAAFFDALEEELRKQERQLESESGGSGIFTEDGNEKAAPFTMTTVGETPGLSEQGCPPIAKPTSTDWPSSKEHFMLVTILSYNRMTTMALPQEPGSVHWVNAYDTTGSVRQVARFEAGKNGLVLFPASGFTLRDSAGSDLRSVSIAVDEETFFGIEGENCPVKLLLRGETNGGKATQIVGFKHDASLIIGRNEEVDLRYASPFVSGMHATLSFENGTFTICDENSANGTYVNEYRIEAGSKTLLFPGDTVSIVGLNITVGKRFISLNNPADAVTLVQAEWRVDFKPITAEESEDDDTSSERESFFPAPRFPRAILPLTLSVDAPPAPEKPDETSIAMRIGPSMVMAFAAVFSGVSMATTVLSSGGSWLRAAPMCAMAVAMICGCVLWPILSRNIQNKKVAEKERQRLIGYAQYLDSARTRLGEASAAQLEILEENRISVNECLRRASVTDPRLMDRIPANFDFLSLRIGTGKEDLAADIRWPDDHFTMDKDDLATMVAELSHETLEIAAAPLALDLMEERVVGITGETLQTTAFARGLLVQAATLHSYEDVKVCVLCDEQQADDWRWAFDLPHAFDDAGRTRFCAVGFEDAAELGLVLERIAAERAQSKTDKRSEMLPRFLVFCASEELAAKSELFSNLADIKGDIGFSLITLARQTKDLPKQCATVIELCSAGPATIRRKALATQAPKSFDADIALTLKQAEQASLDLNSIKLDLVAEKRVLPTSLSYMDMCRAGNLEQLGIAERWRTSDASVTLAAPVGVDAGGELFNLNLHEDFHGPHGLIAGTTGSGKSEFIISWILSMAMTYSPREVAFVLIDYKGGGLAGAFDNERCVLPHLAGTITNLDGAAIARSLVSIKSELQRRQALFNAARDIAGGENVDIYSNLRMFRAGQVSEPCPHLFIVADEFAELKAQEPDFMAELISAARIGRSLGVHLVLATQKPTGVVNEQIWSNSKFKICLKVADKSDSEEMIKRSDAAEIKEPGRFYMLVGYNEFFSSGQAAYAGASYVPKEQWEPQQDNAVELIGATGRVQSAQKPQDPAMLLHTQGSGSQLVAVLGAISEEAHAQNLYARKLWLDPLPELITTDELSVIASKDETDEADAEAGAKSDYELKPLIGLFDDPANQKQHPLYCPLSSEGNALLYGGAASGVESLAATLLYSPIKQHGADTFNAYVVDCGSETLGVFRTAPQVGDVLFVGDEEKMSRLFDMLESEMARRRSILAAFGGSFARFAQEKGGMPSILVLINGAAVFTELEHDYEFSAFGEGDWGELPFGYAGYIPDASTGMQHSRLREYLPWVGRFATPDPKRGRAADPFSLNRWVCCKNDPVNLVDRDGGQPEGIGIEGESGAFDPIEAIDDWWNSQIVGVTTVTESTQMTAGDAEATVEKYNHFDGGVFVAEYGDPDRVGEMTGFSFNTPSIDLFGEGSMCTSLSLDWKDGFPVPSYDISVESNSAKGVVNTVSFLPSSEGIDMALTTDSMFPNVTGATAGIRAKYKTKNVLTWGEVAEIGAIVAVFVLLVIDDVSGAGVIDDPLMGPLLMRLGVIMEQAPSRVPAFSSFITQGLGTVGCACPALG